MPFDDTSLFFWKAPNFSDIQHALSDLKSWQEKYRYIMLLSRELPPMPSELCVDAYLVSGCESQTWMAHYQENDHNYFLGTSEARIIQGLLMILLSLYQAKSTQEAQDIEVEQVFSDLGLMRHLSPSRGNGVQAMMKQLQSMI